MTVAAPVTAADREQAPPAGDREELAEPHGAVGDSLSVAVWTLVSRLTGFARTVVVAAVLGATYFSNTYLFTNSLPNQIFYGFLAGSLFTSLLVPALVGHLDAGDLASARRVAGGLFGTVVALMAAVVPLAVIAAPYALSATGQGAATDGQARVAGLLVLMLMPQVPLYGVIGTATAAMNAQRRFALAAAAPALENLGTMAVLGAVAVGYPQVRTLDDAPLGLLLLLGLGSTGAVALHAAVQWFGAHRTGITLVPRAGWRDPEVRGVLVKAGPAVVQAGLAALQILALLALANRIPGGVTAFQLGLNFYFLPVALAATPTALSLAPRLARLVGAHDGPLFRDTYVRGLVWALFLALPAAAAYLGLSGDLAAAISYGAFTETGGAALVQASLAGLAVGVAAETVFLVSTYACYARGDTATPLRAMIVQAVVCLGGAGGAVSAGLDGPTTLVALGAAFSLGGVVGSVLLVARVLRDSAPGEARLTAPVLRGLLAAAAMVWPATATARTLRDAGLPALAALVGAGVVAAVVYFGLQFVLRAPEMSWVTGAVVAKLRRGTDELPAETGPHRPEVDAMPDADAAPGLLGPAPAPELAAPSADDGPRRPRLTAVQRSAGVRDVLLLLALALSGAVVALSPAAGLALASAVVGGFAVWRRPQLAAYLLIGVTPLVAGIDRGTVMPVFRPNEALLFGLAGLLGLRTVVNARRGWTAGYRPNRIEAAILAFALLGSVAPLIMMVARNRHITGDDLQHAIVLWKLVLLYAIVRFSVTTAAQLRRCLTVSMLAGGVVSLLAVLQSLQLFGVPRLLATFYAPFGVDSALSIGRGSSTLSLPAAVADLAIVNLLIALTLLVRRQGRPWFLGLMAILSVFGVVGAAEFSTFIGMVLALLAFVVVTGHRRLLLYAVPVGVIGSAVLEPVIATRLEGFQSASGLPVSWVGRLRNLQTYFWPRVLEDWNWVFGVRLEARVLADSQEFGYIWIESGHTWLIWTGGLPLLAAYFVLVWVVMRAGMALRRLPGPVAVVGVTLVCAMVADLFLMLLDPHITYRGAADSLFGLMALARPALAERPGALTTPTAGPAREETP